MGNLRVREVFTSLQGEGPFSGQPAIFIRLAGCNLGSVTCPWCDTDHDSQVEEWNQADLANYVLAIIEDKYPNINLVVITGGEPFLQDFCELVTWLACKIDLQIQVETNGTIDPEWSFEDVMIVVSPKQGASVRIRKIDAFKILVQEGDAVEYGHVIDTYLQPIDTKDPIQNKKNMDWAVKLCLETGYKLSLQVHKLLDIK